MISHNSHCTHTFQLCSIREQSELQELHVGTFSFVSSTDASTCVPCADYFNAWLPDLHLTWTIDRPAKGDNA